LLERRSVDALAPGEPSNSAPRFNLRSCCHLRGWCERWWAVRCSRTARDVNELLTELTQIGGAEYWDAHLREQLRNATPDENGVITLDQY
jgi:hypothetical protein